MFIANDCCFQFTARNLSDETAQQDHQRSEVLLHGLLHSYMSENAIQSQDAAVEAALSGDVHVVQHRALSGQVGQGKI